MKSFVIALLFLIPFSANAASRMLATTDWLADNLDKVTVVQVSHDRAKYDAGHIPGALYLDWKDVAVTREGVPNELPPMSDLTSLIRRLGIDPSTHVVLYDDDAGLFAARAYFVLDYAGLDRVSLLDGQLKKWTLEKRALTKDVPVPKESSYAAGPRPEVLVPLRAMEDYVWAANNGKSGDIVLIDARPDAQYAGTEPGEQITRPGHIPGARSLFWMKQVVSEENPVLRPEKELRALYEKAGVKPGNRVITYCRTGGQSSHAYFVAKMLGYKVSMYDGSFIEWSGGKDRPVEK